MPHSLRPVSILVVFAIVVSAVMAPTNEASAAGISIDAGLTPAEGRWILRSQVRYMKRDNHPAEPRQEMRALMFPVVVAYGLRSDLMIMIRQTIRETRMQMAGQSTSNTGLTDLFVLGKYRLYRVNTPGYTLGVAPTVGIEIPSGQEGFSSDTWDLRLGCFVSGRVGTWGLDVNGAWLWNGMAGSGSSDIDPGDELTLEIALANQISLASDASVTLGPVIESSYLRVSSDSRDGRTVDNTGESVLLLSPGLKLTWSSLIVEGLVLLPVWQDQEGLQTERKPGFLIGFRLMN